jgi:hypothetical protein
MHAARGAGLRLSQLICHIAVTCRLRVVQRERLFCGSLAEGYAVHVRCCTSSGAQMPPCRASIESLSDDVLGKMFMMLPQSDRCCGIPWLGTCSGLTCGHLCCMHHCWLCSNCLVVPSGSRPSRWCAADGAGSSHTPACGLLYTLSCSSKMSMSAVRFLGCASASLACVSSPCRRVSCQCIVRAMMLYC